jgi:hypothetical protein
LGINGSGLRPAVANLFNFLAQIVRGFKAFSGDKADAAGVAHRSHNFSTADPLHAAANDRVFDAQQFGDSSFKLLCHF